MTPSPAAGLMVVFTGLFFAAVFLFGLYLGGSWAVDRLRAFMSGSNGE